MGDPYKKEDFLSLRPENIHQTPYNKQTTNPNVGASLEFQLSYDLIIESPRNSKNLIDAVAIAGGIYALLCAVIGCLMSSCVPYFLHLDIIRAIFKIDNNPYKKP